MSVFCFGANHKTAGIALREKIFACENQIIERLPAVKNQFGLNELAVLSTCNRFEIFGTCSLELARSENFSTILCHAMQALDSINMAVLEDLKKVAYTLHGNDAVRHLLAVASSLDSLVVGETQITGQFKESLALAALAGTSGPILTRLGQEALATAKKVRTKTAIGRGRISISHAAVDLVGRIFRNPSEQNFVVLGAGEMAEVAARYITQKKPKSLTIVNRSTERAKSLIKKLGCGNFGGFEWLPEYLQSADIVISATASPTHVVSEKMIRDAMRVKGRGSRLLLVDIALPRDIAPACGDHDDVFLFDIDDLQQVVAEGREARLAAAQQAAEIIDRATDNWSRWLSHMTVAPTIQSIQSYIDASIRREALKTLSSDPLLSMLPEQKERLWKLFDIITSRLTSGVGRGLRQLADEGKGETAIEIIERIFSTDDHSFGADFTSSPMEVDRDL